MGESQSSKVICLGVILCALADTQGQAVWQMQRETVMEHLEAMCCLDRSRKVDGGRLCDIAKEYLGSKTPHI